MKNRLVSTIGISTVLSLLITLFPVGSMPKGKVLAASEKTSIVETVSPDDGQGLNLYKTTPTPTTPNRPSPTSKYTPTPTVPTVTLPHAPSPTSKYTPTPASTVVMPNVVDLTIEEALIVLHPLALAMYDNSGCLRVYIDDVETHDPSQDGIVISQDIEAGTVMELDSEYFLKLEVGEYVFNPSFVMPNIVDLTIEEALMVLDPLLEALNDNHSSLGLGLKEITTSFPDKDGLILSQFPEAGTVLDQPDTEYVGEITVLKYVPATPVPSMNTPRPTPISGTPIPTPISGTPRPTPISGTPIPTPISGTPIPTPITHAATPYPAVPMPDVVGMYYQDAETKIRQELQSPVFDEVNIEIAWVQNYDSQKDFTVLSQNPTAGSPVYGNHSRITVKLIVAEKAPTPSPTSAKPGKPENVKAVAESASSIKVSWDAVSDAAGYQVWRGTSANGTFTAIGSVTTTSRVSTGLTAGTTYYYKVRSYKMVEGQKVYGDYSSVVSAETLLAKPAGVKAVSESATSVNVSWNAVSGAAGYQVWRGTSSTGTFTAVGSVTGTNRVCSGLTTGTTYYFKVRAYKEVSGKKVYGDYSTVVNAAPKPAAPSNVKAVPETTTGIKISWSAVSGVTGYQVLRSTSATGTFTAIGSVTETSRVSTGLTAGTTYYYKVRAYKEVNGTRIYGAFSSVVSAMPKPTAPGGVKATVSSATKVTVSWNAVAGATGYEVYRATSATGTYSKLGTVTTTSRACPGLTTGTKYYFKVRAYVEINGTKYYSNYSSVVNATPKK